MSVHSELAQRVLEQSAVAQLGELALEAADPRVLMRAAAEVVARTLEVEFAGVLELAEGGHELVSRSGYGWPEDMDGVAFTFAETSQAGYTLTVDEPVVVEDFVTERRFADTEFFADRGIRSGISVRIRGKSGPLGVLGAHAMAPRKFSPDGLAFLQSVANVIGAAVERHLAEERLRHQALHDALTGLPNRTLLLDRLEHALARRGSAALAVLFVDLDDFKLINDTLGHHIGDEVLREIAPRIAAAVRPGDTVARFGGDEFVVLCEDIENQDHAMAVAGRVREAFSVPVTVAGFPRLMTASIGVVVSPGGAADPTVLIRDADAAVYRAKARGRGWIEKHDAAARRRLVRRVALEDELRLAITAEQFVPYFQPIVDLETGVWRHMEALARWNHPARGLVLPAGFIDIAEHTGLISGIGEQILRLACVEAARWKDGHVGFNVSHRQLNAGDFAHAVTEALAAAGLEPERLTLELTETALFESEPVGVRSLRELTDMGAQVVLDDFGTGYSSLSHLRRFRVTAVKIDRSFIARAHEPGQDQVIVRAMISMATELGLAVVAEGVETEEQADALRALGCPLAQGYLFARPAPMDELLATAAPWAMRTA